MNYCQYLMEKYFSEWDDETVERIGGELENQEQMRKGDIAGDNKKRKIPPSETKKDQTRLSRALDIRLPSLRGRLQGKPISPLTDSEKKALQKERKAGKKTGMTLKDRISKITGLRSSDTLKDTIEKTKKLKGSN